MQFIHHYILPIERQVANPVGKVGFPRDLHRSQIHHLYITIGETAHHASVRFIVCVSETDAPAVWSVSRGTDCSNCPGCSGVPKFDSSISRTAYNLTGSTTGSVPTAGVDRIYKLRVRGGCRPRGSLCALWSFEDIRHTMECRLKIDRSPRNSPHAISSEEQTAMHFTPVYEGGRIRFVHMRTWTGILAVSII